MSKTCNWSLWYPLKTVMTTRAPAALKIDVFPEVPAEWRSVVFCPRPPFNRFLHVLSHNLPVLEKQVNSFISELAPTNYCRSLNACLHAWKSVRKKPYIKVRNLQHTFLDWKWHPPPFWKFIRFGSLARPLGTQCLVPFWPCFVVYSATL